MSLVFDVLKEEEETMGVEIVKRKCRLVNKHREHRRWLKRIVGGHGANRDLYIWSWFDESSNH